MHASSTRLIASSIRSISRPSFRRALHQSTKATQSFVLGAENNSTIRKDISEAGPQSKRFLNVLVPRAPAPAPPSKHSYATEASIMSGGFNAYEETAIHLPALADYGMTPETSEIRVPYLPDNYSHFKAPEPEPVVSKPIIHTIAGESTHITPPSPFTEILDNTSVRLNFLEDLGFASGPGLNETLPAEETLGSIFKGMVQPKH